MNNEYVVYIIEAFILWFFSSSECGSREYKSATDNSACQLCPQNSFPSRDKKSCLCNDGFYKLPQDTIKPCEGKKQQ